METIKSYIENMFAGMPQTEDVLKMKKQLLADMEEKYQSLKAEGKSENEAVGVVISEFGNIDELAEAMGVDMHPAEKLPVVSPETARKFLRKNRSSAFLTSVGIILCILSPSMVIFCGVMFDGLPFGDIAAGLGVMSLFVMVAFAVGLFIYSDNRMKEFEFIKKPFFISSETKAAIRNEQTSAENTASLATIVGVALCIIAPVPLILLSVLTGEADLFSGIGVLILLTMVALGVFILVYFNEIKEGFEKILQQGEFTAKGKKKSKIMDLISSLYWSFILIIFFIWGFVFDGWEISWIVFVIGAILYGIIETIVKFLTSGKEGLED